MELLNELEKSLEGGKKKKFELLYKMSKDGYKPETFHKLCDNKGPTLTVIRTVDNITYGGYTSESWSSQSGFKTDKNAFIFFKKDRKDSPCEVVKVVESANQYAIYCTENWGPVFGGGTFGGYDLKSFASGVTKQSDNTFKLDGSRKINNSFVCSHKESFSNFPFKSNDVKDVEVFEVEDDELKTNWRPVIYESANGLREKFHGLKPKNQVGVQKYNILLAGIIGAGKSSFCNTFLSAVNGEITEVAPHGNHDYSVTNKLKAYSFEPKEKTMSVRLFDIRGIEESRGLEHEIGHLLDGTLPQLYVFEDKSTELTTKGPKTDTVMDDKIHLLCFVLDATKIEILTDQQLKHIANIQTTTHHKDIKMVALVTKIDELCSKVSADLNHLYKSPTIKKAAQRTATLLGLTEKHVHPVCNYTNETKCSEYKDKLALNAVLDMVLGIEDSFKKDEEPKLQTDGWRSRGTGLKEKTVFIKDQIDSYEYSELAQKHGFRVLVIGAKKSGKSSFLNSVMTSLLGKINLKAPAGSSAAKRTKKIQAYPLKSASGDGTVTTLKITMIDMPGLKEEGDEIDDRDISYVLGGHVPNKFQFKQHVSEAMDKFKAKPKIGDKHQCVCFIIDITDIGGMEKKINQRITSIQEVLLDKEIPFVILLTKVDTLCPDLEADVSKVYESHEVKKRVDEVKTLFDISLGKIFPIKNYTNDSTKTEKDIDALILEALKEIIDQCEMFLESYEESDEE